MSVSKSLVKLFQRCVQPSGDAVIRKLEGSSEGLVLDRIGNTKAKLWFYRRNIAQTGPRKSISAIIDSIIFKNLTFTQQIALFHSISSTYYFHGVECYLSCYIYFPFINPLIMELPTVSYDIITQQDMFLSLFQCRGIYALTWASHIRQQVM